MRFVTRALGVALTVATISAYFGQGVWPVGMLDHLGLQILWAFLLVLLASAVLRDRLGFVWGLVAAINAYPLLSLSIPPPEAKTPPALTALHANIDREGGSVAKVVAALRESQADILFLQEVTPETLPVIETGFVHHRLILGHPLPNSHGSALFLRKDSLVDVAHAEVILSPDTSRRPVLIADLVVAGRVIKVMSAHPTRPKADGTFQAQRRELRDIAVWAKAQQEAGFKTLVIGDFNATATSRLLHGFAQDAGLVTSQQGYPLQMTWPAGLPLPFQIAIDHAFHSPDLQTQLRWTGPDIGSDHLPLGLTLAFKNPVTEAF